MFDRREINTGRQFEIDVAKALAVIFMVVVHAFEQLTNMANIGLYRVVEFFGCPPAAGVFMFSMGIGMVYTKHNSPAEFAKRGIKLILMGIALNFFRETILILAGKILAVENAWKDVSILHSMLIIDILQFAGMAFLITALLKKLKMKPWMILAVAVLMNAIGGIVAGSFGTLPAAAQDIIGMCIYTAIEPAFPAFGWYIYPALGICFAHILRYVSNKTVFYGRMLILSIVNLVFITLGYAKAGLDVTEFFMTSAYYEQSPITVLWCLSVVAVCISVYYFLSLAIKGKLQKTVQYISANVNTIYIIQWLIITYSIAILVLIDKDVFPSEWGVLIGLIITTISIAICMLYNKLKVKVKVHK